MQGGHQDLNFSNVWIDEYGFKKKLGGGAYASVWLADECANREVIQTVAIKVFVDDFNNRDSFNETFANFRLDLKFLAELAPNNPIVQYFGHRMPEIAVQEDGTIHTVTSRPDDSESRTPVLTLFLVIMEYADGGHLGSTYRDSTIVGKVDYSYLDHFVDVCTGLAVAHEHNIVHCDVKPQNLMWFRKQNKVKLGDFGIAKHLDDSALVQQFAKGSLPYMAPEVFQENVAPEPARDVYALGCTFYELLVGSRAFEPSVTTVVDAPTNFSAVDAYRALHEESLRPEAAMKVPDLISIKFSGLLRDMMSVDPRSRPSLADVTDLIEKEKDRLVSNTTTDERSDSIRISDKPVYRSEYAVNPVFRQEQLKESLFFIFVTMHTKSAQRYRRMFAILEQEFADTYFVCEVYGRYDHVIRVWAPSNRNKVQIFCRKLIDEVLDNDKRTLRIMACEDVRYLGAAKNGGLPEEVNPVEVLVNLQAAQERNPEGAVRWLRANNVYVRRQPKSVEGSKILCFCLISNSQVLAEPEREANWSLMLEQIAKSRVDTNGHCLSAYLRAYQPVGTLTNETSDYMIAYVAKNFNDVISIPTFIMDDRMQRRFNTGTLIATGRFFVDSDRVMIT